MDRSSTLCPKCHRPLENRDGQSSVCCAEQSLLWQCRACGMRSEGFAFPYGRCPHCGGRLERVDSLGVAPHRDPAVLAAVRTAFEIELGGRAFYQRAALDCDDAELRELFGRFAVMEGEHMETLSRRYHLDLPNPSPEFRLETAAVHAGIGSVPRDARGLFELAITLEQRAADFYAERAKQCDAGSVERRLYDELAAEEHEHAHLLRTEFARWREHKAGLFSQAASETTGEPLNAAQLLLSGHEANRIAVVCGDEQLSYGELRDRVGRAAAAWRARGLRPGDRVAVKLPDGLDWIVCWLGTIWAGGVAVGVNPRVPTPEWHYILEEAGFNVIVAESDADTPEPWRSRLITLAQGRHLVAAAAPVEPALGDPQTPAFWLHTSGTSGKPKAVVHAHRCVREVSRISAERMGIRSGDRLFASSKLFFAYPLANLLLAGLRIGATLILDPQWPTPASVAATIAAQQPTVLFSVPSLYRALLHEGQAGAVAAAGVRVCVSAGEALPASLRAAWRDATGLPMIDGYGASEVLVLVLTALEDDDALRASPGTQVEPLDAQAAAAGAPTRLLIRSPMQALGYLDRPAAQADSFRDGRFCPADLFVRTDSGGWRFAGREDSMVKVKGRWVNLVDLEEHLGARLPGLREGAAVWVSDADGMGAIAYFYAAAPLDEEAMLDELRRRIAALPPYQRPLRLLPIETLPRTPTGKLLRRRLQELERDAF
ncbi:MAG: AMP-binding protein [Burkholderiales bacterium]|nr:AMP-binding protein [Burkholderiales bacterium]